MIHKLIIVYNVRSSHYQAVRREVLVPARQLKGWLVGKYELKPTDVDDNAAQLAKLLHDGDLVVAVGGDGTAAVAVNGIMLSKKKVTFSALGYGNFNDVAQMLGTRRPVEYGGEYVGGILEIVANFEAGKVGTLRPMEIKVNGKHWRYAPAYLTMGMFAESTAVLNSTAVRKKLRTGKKHWLFSIVQLAKWYFRERKQDFIPVGVTKQTKRGAAEYPKVELEAGVTDYLAINSSRVAKFMRGSKSVGSTDEFLSVTGRLGNFWRLAWFMLRSILVKIPGRLSSVDVLSFAQPAMVTLHAEGESEELTGVEKIEVQKSEQALQTVGM